jgi:hypothetical protein
MLNNIIWLVFDSARYDAFVAAKTPAIDTIGCTERRFSYASWTAPSHYAFMMGLPPHANEPGVLAADVHRRDLGLWQQRIGGDTRVISFADFAPSLSLPGFLKKLGYRTEAYVSLPVLNPHTPIAQHFDRFELMPAHNDLAAIVAKLEFANEPSFTFINTGETHYPYTLPHESGSDLPRLPGVHGVWRDLDDLLTRTGTPQSAAQNGIRFDTDALRPLWDKQVSCIEYLDGVVASLIEKAPLQTWFMITADHGELFGEDGYFGHGPVVHEKAFEVFFVEGKNPRSVTARNDEKDQAIIMARLKKLGYA